MKKFHMLTILTFVFSQNYFSQNWDRMEINQPKLVTSVVNNNSTLYASTNGKGIYVSYDSGLNWLQKNSGLNTLNIITLLALPLKGLVFAGTDNNSTNGGIYLSSNNGTDWNKVSDKNIIGVYTFTMKDSILYAGASSGSVWKSNDWGKTWIKVGELNFNTAIYSLTFLNNILFASTLGEGVFKSIDFGKTWSLSSNRLTNKKVRTLAVLDNYLFAGTDGNGVFVSVDNGISWINTNLGNKVVTSLYVFNSPTKGKILYAGSGDINRYPSLGANWEDISSGFIWTSDWDSNFITAFAEIDNKVICGAYGKGVSVSYDYAESFLPLNYENQNIKYLKPYDNRLYILGGSFYDLGAPIGKRNPGIFYLSENSQQLKLRPYPSIVRSDNVTDFMIFNNKVFFITEFIDYSSYTTLAEGELFFSNDLEIDSWNKGKVVDENNYGMESLLSLGTISTKLLIGSYRGLAWSTDYGNTITWYNDTKIRTQTVICIYTFQNSILLGTYRGFYISTDAGVTWESRSNGMTGNNGTELIRKLIMIGNSLFATTMNGLYKSSDLGLTWNKSNLGLTNNNIQCIISYLSNLFVGTDDGIYLSTNDGFIWQKINGDLPNASISSLAIYTISNIKYIIVGTNGKGLYKLKLSDVITDVKNDYSNIPLNYSLSQNYPNPFNPETTIQYSIPKSEFVTLKIFDALGKEIATLANEQKLPGYYEVKFDGSNLSSGVYFYRLQSGSFIQTKKFVLLK